MNVCCPSIFFTTQPQKHATRARKPNLLQLQQAVLQKLLEETKKIYPQMNLRNTLESSFEFTEFKSTDLTPPSCTPLTPTIEEPTFSNFSIIKRSTLPRLELKMSDYLVLEWDDTLQLNTDSCQTKDCPLFFGAVELLQQTPTPHILTKNKPTNIRSAWNEWTKTEFPSSIPIVTWTESHMFSSKSTKLKEMILEENKQRQKREKSEIQRVYLIEDNKQTLDEVQELRYDKELKHIDFQLYYIFGQKERALKERRLESGFLTFWQQLWFAAQKIATKDLFPNPITPIFNNNVPLVFEQTTLLCSHNDFLKHLRVGLTKFLEANSNQPYILVFPLNSKGINSSQREFCQKSAWWIVQFAYRFLVNTSNPPIDVCALEFAKANTSYTNMLYVDDGAYSGQQAADLIRRFNVNNTHPSTLHLVFAVVTLNSLWLLDFSNETLSKIDNKWHAQVYYSMLLPMYRSLRGAFPRIIWSHKVPDSASIGHELPLMLECHGRQQKDCIEIPYKKLWKSCDVGIVFP